MITLYDPDSVKSLIASPPSLAQVYPTFVLVKAIPADTHLSSARNVSPQDNKSSSFNPSCHVVVVALPGRILFGQSVAPWAPNGLPLLLRQQSMDRDKMLNRQAHELLKSVY